MLSLDDARDLGLYWKNINNVKDNPAPYDTRNIPYLTNSWLLYKPARPAGLIESMHLIPARSYVYIYEWFDNDDCYAILSAAKNCNHRIFICTTTNDAYVYDVFLRNVSCMYVNNLLNINNSIKKEYRFWCANAAPRIHRQIMHSFLSTISSTACLTWHNNMPRDKFEQQNSTFFNNAFVYAAHATSTIATTTSTSAQRGIYDDNILSADFVSSLLQSQIAIITETAFADSSAYFSEKVFHACFARIPFILVAPPYTLKYMKLLGFKTFGSWWDESYDNIENDLDRMLAIFELIKWLDSLTDTHIQQIRREMHATLNHNFRVLKNFRNNRDVIIDWEAVPAHKLNLN